MNTCAWHGCKRRVKAAGLDCYMHQPARAELPTFKRLIARRLRDISSRMASLGRDMEYFGGFGELGAKGRELSGAASIARNWAAEIDREKSP